MNARTVSFSIFQAAENIPTSRGRNIAIYTGLNGRLPRWFPGMSGTPISEQRVGAGRSASVERQGATVKSQKSFASEAAQSSYALSVIVMQQFAAILF